MLPHVIAWAFFAACGIFYPSTERAALRFNDLFINLFEVSVLPALLANDTLPSHSAVSQAASSLPLYGGITSSAVAAAASVDSYPPAMHPLGTTADISGGGEPPERAATSSLLSEALEPLPRSVPQHLHGSYDRLSHCASRHGASCEIAVVGAGSNAPPPEPERFARFSEIAALLWAPVLVYGCIYLAYQYWRWSARMAVLEGSLEQQPGYIASQQKVQDLEILLQQIQRSAREQTDSLLAAATEVQHLERQLGQLNKDLAAAESKHDALKQTVRETSDRLDDARMRNIVLEEQEKRSRRAHDTLVHDKLYAARRAEVLEAENKEQKAEIEHRKQLHAEALRWTHNQRFELGKWEFRLISKEHESKLAQKKVEADTARLVALEKENQSLEKDIDGLFAELQEAERKIKSLSLVQEVNSGLWRELEVLENDVKKQRFPTEQKRKKLEQEIARQNKVLSTREKSIIELKKEADGLRKQRDELKLAFEKEQKSAEETSATLTAANKNIVDLELRARAGNAKIQEQAEMLQQAHESLNYLQECAKVGNAKLQEQEQMLQHLRKNLADELQALKKLQSDRTTDFEQLKANTRAQINQAFEDAVAGVEKRFVTDIQLAQAKAKGLEEELQKAKSEIQALRDQSTAPASCRSEAENGPHADRPSCEGSNAQPNAEMCGADPVGPDGSSGVKVVGEGSSEQIRSTVTGQAATFEETPAANESKNKDMQNQDLAMPGPVEITPGTQTDQQPQSLPAQIPDQPGPLPDGPEPKPRKISKMRARRTFDRGAFADLEPPMPPPGFAPVDQSQGASSPTKFAVGNPEPSTLPQDRNKSVERTPRPRSGDNDDEQDNKAPQRLLKELDNKDQDSTPSSHPASQPYPQNDASSAPGDSSQQTGTTDDANSEADAEFEWEDFLDPQLKG